MFNPAKASKKELKDHIEQTLIGRLNLPSKGASPAQKADYLIEQTQMNTRSPDLAKSFKAEFSKSGDLASTIGTFSNVADKAGQLVMNDVTDLFSIMNDPRVSQAKNSAPKSETPAQEFASNAKKAVKKVLSAGLSLDGPGF